MKKILIDDRWAGTGGIGTFAEEVNKITSFKSADFNGKPYSPLDCLKTSIALIGKKDTVVFFPGYIPPLYTAVPYVFTIHDLNHIERKENTSILKRLFYKFVIKRGCRNAQFVFTVSEFSRERIINWAGVPGKKVINVGNGVSTDFIPTGNVKKIGFEYFLCVSNRKAHKNEIGTIIAFAQASIPHDIKLVFTGKRTDILDKIISEYNVKDRVIFTGFIDADELPAYYRGAKALVFVSFYEGFGLPVIEAMASGIPVITSKTTSLGEVAGTAALLVDPENVAEISSAITEICHNSLLKDKLIQNGIAQAKKYSWELTADRIRKHLLSISS
jgi:glycosyltransferase involved in cell wall biosynthesis